MVFHNNNTGPFRKKPVPRPSIEYDKSSSHGGGQSLDDEILSNNSTGSRRRQRHFQRPYNTVQTEEYNEAPGSTVTSFEIGESEPDENGEATLERHLSLLDLIAIGVGGTIGSGLFVLAGLVAHEYAGPSAVISWAIAGVAACLSGSCYAELSARIPLPGGAYAYTYVAMGELPAILAAACLSLEYTVAASAVARSWGDKCVVWLQEELGEEHWILTFLSDIGSFSPLAFLIATGTVVLLLNGVKESKIATNIFTTLKVSVVLFMIMAGFSMVTPSNWSPFLPSQFGVAGIFRGATSTFFGYIGYDQVCCLAGEAVNPKQNLPRAIILTLGFVTVIYMVASLALTGMVPYQEISPVSGFPQAFYTLGANVAGHITAAGEVITLPIVVLITLMAQPRLQYAMSEDGLLPAFFRKLDRKGNLWNGTLFAGAIMVLIATFIPFTHLNDMISCAVLSALSMTDTSLILMWHEHPDPRSHLAEWLMVAFHVGASIAAMSVTHFLDSVAGKLAALLAICCMFLSVCGIYSRCPQSDVFGGHRQHHGQDNLRTDEGYFRTPLLPWWPCLAIFVNWYLIAQLEVIGVAGLLGFLLAAILYYFTYSVHRSSETNNDWHNAVDTAESSSAK